MLTAAITVITACRTISRPIDLVLAMRTSCCQPTNQCEPSSRSWAEQWRSQRPGQRWWPGPRCVARSSWQWPRLTRSPGWIVSCPKCCKNEVKGSIVANLKAAYASTPTCMQYVSCLRPLANVAGCKCIMLCRIKYGWARNWWHLAVETICVCVMCVQKTINYS